MFAETDGEGVTDAWTTDGGVALAAGGTFGCGWVVVTEEEEDGGCGGEKD